MIKNYKIKHNQESNQLLLMLHAPIFSAKVWSRNDSKDAHYDVFRNKHERIIYKGYQLDVKYDFQLFAFLVSKVQQIRSNKFSFQEREMLNALSIKANEKKVIDPLHARLERFKRCSIEIHRMEFDDNGNQYLIDSIDTTLLETLSWDTKTKEIKVTFSSKFGDVRSGNFDRLKVDIKRMDKIKGDYSNYARCLFLYFLSRSFNIHYKADLLNRIAFNIKSNKHKNRVLKQALDLLEKEKFIKKWEPEKSSAQEIPQIKIFWNNSKDKEEKKDK